MTHHKQNIALLQMIKGSTLWKDTANKLVCNLTANLLVETLRITIKNSASNPIQPEFNFSTDELEV